MLFTNYGAKNILVQASSELTKSSDITIRFVMRASNNVCVFHSIYFWSVSGSIWSQARPGVSGPRWKSLCCLWLSLIPSLHHLCSVWWNVQASDTWTQSVIMTPVWDEEERDWDYRLEIILCLSCPNCWAQCLLLPAPILLFSIFLIRGSGSWPHGGASQALWPA